MRYNRGSLCIDAIEMSAWAIVERQSCVLLVQRGEKNSRPEQWCFPGGKVKQKETEMAACIREVKEETGLDVEISKLVATIDDRHYFLCVLIDEEQQVILKRNECQSYCWIDPTRILEVGMVMNLKDTHEVFDQLGYSTKNIDLALVNRNYSHFKQE